SKASAFDPATFRDRYEEALLAHLKAKQAGAVPERRKTFAPPHRVVNLMEALRRSVASRLIPVGCKSSSMRCPTDSSAPRAQRPHCVAGVRGFELRNVEANYPFERSRGFPGSEPNSGHGDHSRLSCSAGDTQLGGWVLQGSSASVLHRRWPSCGVPRSHELAALSFDQKMIRRRQSQ